MEGTGQTQTSDVDAFISRKVQAKVRSTVDYELAFDPSVFVPKFDYLVSARVHVRVNGRVNGNRNCGLLWMSNCKIDNVDSSEDYFVPVKVAMRAATRFRNTGSVSVDWESTSGGSGMAGGLIMGGTRVFTATGIVLALIVDSIESQP